MSKEKQIEEMAKIASKCMTSWLNNETPKALPDYIAEALYNADYRKQSEGEWHFYSDYFSGKQVTGWTCGNCNKYSTGIRNYCPECGAKMKGGEE